MVCRPPEAEGAEATTEEMGGREGRSSMREARSSMRVLLSSTRVRRSSMREREREDVMASGGYARDPCRPVRSGDKLRSFAAKREMAS